MKKSLILLPVMLVFLGAFTFARSDRFDSSIYNNCVQQYKIQRSNAEAQASNWLWFSRNWSAYLNSLPSDSEIEAQCEYEAENWVDDYNFNYYQNQGYQATLNWNYDAAISYYEKALYYQPVGSQLYNAVANVISQLKIVKEDSNWRYYYQLWLKEMNSYNFDGAIEYFKKARDVSTYWSENYNGAQQAISLAQQGKAALKEDQAQKEKQAQAQKNLETAKYYADLWEKELNKWNWQKSKDYYETALSYTEKWTDAYNALKNMIKQVDNIIEIDKKERATATSQTKNTTTNKSRESLDNAINALYAGTTKKRADLIKSIGDALLKKDERTQQKVKWLIRKFRNAEKSETRLMWDYLYELYEYNGI